MEGVLIESISQQAHDDLKKFIDGLEKGISTVVKFEKGLKKVSAPSGVKQSYEQTTKAIADLNKKVLDYEKANAKLLRKINALSRKRNTTRKQLTEEQRLTQSVEREKKRLTLATSEEAKELIKLRLQKNEVNKQSRTEARLTDSLFSVYQKVDAKLAKTANEYRNLAIRKELFDNLNAKEVRRMDTLEKRIQRYDSVLKKVDGTMGRHGRNVGNYRSTYDGLGFSIAQLSREMPAFANSMQTGFMAISNNIPMLVDEITKLKNQNVQLAASGKPTVNVLKSVGKAIFSLNGLLGVGITILTVFGPKLLDMAFGMSEAEKATEKANKEIKEQNEAIRENIKLRQQALGNATDFLNSAEIADEFRGLLDGSIRDTERAGLALIELADRMSKLNIENADAIKNTKLLQSDRIRIGLNALEIAKKQNELAEERLRVSDEVVKKNEINEQFKKGEISAELRQVKLMDLGNTSLEKSLDIQGRIKQLKDENNRISSKGVDIENKGNEGSTNRMQKEQELFELEKLRLERTIALKERTIAAEKTSAADRVVANEDMHNLLLVLAQKTLEFELKAAGLTAIGKELIIEKHLQKVEELNRQNSERISKIGQEEVQRQRDNLNAQKSDLQAHLTLIQQQELAALKKSYLKQEISTKEYEDKLAQIRLEHARASLLAKLQILELELEAQKAAGNDVTVLLGKIQDIRNQLYAMDASAFEKYQKDKEKSAEDSQARIENILKGSFVRLGSELGIQASTIENLFEAYKDGFKDIGKTAQAFGALMVDVVNSIAAAQNARIDREIENLELEKEISIAFAGDSAAARGAIEERYRERVARLRERQARNDKAAKITSAIINTATAVTATLAEGGAAAIPVSLLVAALGAAEVAVIASQPIPQFKDGVENFKGGKAIVGDGGKHEYITDKKGKLIGVSPKVSTLVDLPEGSSVWKDENAFMNEYNSMLSANNINPFGGAIENNVKNTQLIKTGITEEGFKRVLQSTLGKQSKQVVNIDKSGIKTFVRAEHGSVERLNNKVTFKGKNV